MPIGVVVSTSDSDSENIRSTRISAVVAVVQLVRTPDCDSEDGGSIPLGHPVLRFGVVG